MHLKLTLNRPGTASPADLALDVESDTAVAEVARALVDRDPERRGGAITEDVTLRIDGPRTRRVLGPDRTVGEAAMRSGDIVSVVSTAGQFVDADDDRVAAATLIIKDGPSAGVRFQLRRGANEVGRDASCDVQLDDPMASKRHARFNITDLVEVIDLGSANGVYVGGNLVQRVNLRPGEEVVIGDTTLVIEHHRAQAAVESGNTVEFNRSPYLDPRYVGEKLKAPEPPAPPGAHKFPFLVMVAPLVMGAVMFALTKQLISVVFIALSPLLMVGTYFQQKIADRKSFEERVRQYHAALDHLAAVLDALHLEETAGRCHEHPSDADVITATHARGPLLWARRPDRPGFLELRLGRADLPSRTSVELPLANNTLPELWDALNTVVRERRLVKDVPLVASLAEVGVAGVAGPWGGFAVGTAGALLVQILGLHSPSEVSLLALLPTERADEWDWLKWVPHVDPLYSTFDGPHVGVGGSGALAVAMALRDLIDQRHGVAEGEAEPAAGARVMVVVVDDDVPVDRSLLTELIERGPQVGVYFIWVAESVERLPARVAAYAAFDPPSAKAVGGILDGGISVLPIDTEPVVASDLVAFTRALAPLVDAGARHDDAGELPSRVSFLDSVGLDLASSPSAVVDRWRASDSLPQVALDQRAGAGPPLVTRRKRTHPLHALVGVAVNENMNLDLRAHGPHALVGGTTGAGKSEFLQSWVMGLAVNHSPARITFLFVDYKGGAAFSECVRLPHTVGLVTDLTPHLVKRALRSLNAELRYREHVLNRKKAKDIVELEMRGDPDCPPSLVIVVDEFAALVSEVPEFVDGVVNVAQRGRSLGLHLILATQRPAGVIRDNLRANTNLRIALRMADETDSDDVVGSKVAAMFDPALPGRAVAKMGPGRLTPFQSAYVGGWTTGESPPPPLVIGELQVGGRTLWETSEPEVQEDDADPGPNDLHRLVDSVRGASDAAQIDAPRRPWLPELAEVYDLAKIPQSRTDRELVFAVLDTPDDQQQVPFAFYPDVDGNMAVIGTGGSGKSTFLRTLAVAAGLSLRGGPCHVYGLDFGSRSLHMLEPLPHVGDIVNGDDDERVARVLRMLREAIDERAGRYAAVRAGTITEYRELANAPDEPRLLLLVDGFPTFRQDYEAGPRMRLYDRFQAIATDGRQVGVHVVIAADRVGSIPSALGSMIQRRLVLRLATENDYAMAGVDADALAGSPPGRGMIDGGEMQVAVLGGSADNAGQAAAIQALADRMIESVSRDPAPPVGRLPEVTHLGALPANLIDGLLPIGVADETLGPAGVSLADPIFVVGPPRSGKTTTLVTMALALRRDRPDRTLVYLGDGSTALISAVEFDKVVLTEGNLDEPLLELMALIKAADGSPGAVALFFEDAPRLSGLPEDPQLVELFEVAARGGQIIVADGETSAALGSSWGLMKSIKVARHGLALVPDQYDGDSIFKTPFPPINRKDYPPGRAVYVRAGSLKRLQVALPDLETT